MLAAASFKARALLVGARVDLRNWPEGETLARAPLAAKLPGSRTSSRSTSGSTRSTASSSSPRAPSARWSISSAPGTRCAWSGTSWR
jgi:hypothetical protein